MTSFDDLEAIYERLAASIDDVGEAKAAIFLAKLVLMLAARAGDGAAVLAAIDQCRRDL